MCLGIGRCGTHPAKPYAVVYLSTKLNSFHSQSLLCDVKGAPLGWCGSFSSIPEPNAHPSPSVPVIIIINVLPSTGIPSQQPGSMIIPLYLPIDARRRASLVSGSLRRDDLCVCFGVLSTQRWTREQSR